MNIIENRLLFECFVLIVCSLGVTRGQIYSRFLTSSGNQNDYGNQPNQQMEIRSKRSLSECGVHGQKLTGDSLSAETTLPGEWPWVVALFRSSEDTLIYQCGASLIGNRFVITVAHCVYNYYEQRAMKLKDIVVVVGARDVSLNTYALDNIRSLTTMYVHTRFNATTNNDNIALLVLNKQVTYSKLVNDVCSWKENEDLMAIQHGSVVGWGEGDMDASLAAPQRFNMSIISLTICRELNMEHANLINEETFCADIRGTKRFHSGFSGSGLYIEQGGHWWLRGLVSTVLRNSSEYDSYVVYTDIAKYANWISDTIFYWTANNRPPVVKTGDNAAWTRQCSMLGEVNPLVTGGHKTREGKWPWHVAVYHNEQTGSSIDYQCGGSLISASHVLTAAHCFIDTRTRLPVGKRSILILLGTHNIKTVSVGVQFKLVDRLDIHPEYKAQTQYKDIAVVKLSSPAEFTAVVRPVCIWPKDEVDLSNVVDKYGSVVGWGYDENGLLAEELMLAELPVVSELMCIRSHNNFYLKYTNNFTFCAGSILDTSVCNGDSGGGIVFKLRSSAHTEEWFLRGLVSLRPATVRKCDPSQYVIYTDVAKYLDWIKDSVSRDMA